MEKELETIDITECYLQLQAQGAMHVQLVIIQHDESNRYDTSLVARGTTETGETVEVVCCPRPCRIGEAFNPENTKDK